MSSEVSYVKQLEDKISILEQENKNLHETVAFLSRKLFGKSSEKTSSVLGQVSLFDEAEVEADPDAPEPSLEDVKNHVKRKYPGQREALLKDLPHEKVICKLTQEDQYCEFCNDKLVLMGTEFVRTEIEYIPAKVRVIDYYRESYECKTCKKAGEPYIEKSPMNTPVIMHSMASPSSVANVMYQKFVNALPLYRQEKDWENYGVKLSRATMVNWIIVASRDWLAPLVELLHKKMQQEKYLHADELCETSHNSSYAESFIM